MTNDTLLARGTLWPATLALATVLGSFALACVFPFAAFAALAALTLGRREGLALVALVWLANQLTGFFLLSFPWDAQAVGHGIAILLITLTAFEMARFASARAGSNSFVRGGVALVTAFVVYLTLMRVYAGFGGGVENFTLAINLEVARNDALWFAGLMALRAFLSRSTGQSVLRSLTA